MFAEASRSLKILFESPPISGTGFYKNHKNSFDSVLKRLDKAQKSEPKILGKWVGYVNRNYNFD